LIVRRRGKETYIASLMSADEAGVLFEARITLESYLTQQAPPIAFATAHESVAEQHERILLALSNRGAASPRQVMAQHIRSAWRAIEAAAEDEADVQSTSP
jgi:DNA-binding GntR family transcriptional regulator